MITLLEINKAINDKIKSTLVGTVFSVVPLLTAEEKKDDKEDEK